MRLCRIVRNFEKLLEMEGNLMVCVPIYRREPIHSGDTGGILPLICASPAPGGGGLTILPICGNIQNVVCGAN